MIKDKTLTLGLQDPDSPNFTRCHLTFLYLRLVVRGPIVTLPAKAATTLIFKIGYQANNIGSKFGKMSEIGIIGEGKHSRNVISYHFI